VSIQPDIRSPLAVVCLVGTTSRPLAVTTAGRFRGGSHVLSVALCLAIIIPAITPVSAIPRFVSAAAATMGMAFDVPSQRGSVEAVAIDQGPEDDLIASANTGAAAVSLKPAIAPLLNRRLHGTASPATAKMPHPADNPWLAKPLQTQVG